MVIVFYDANDEKFYIASTSKDTKVVHLNDPDLLSYIPNDDILYVTNGHYLTKEQFGMWISGEFQMQPDQNEPSRWDGFMQDNFDNVENVNNDQNLPQYETTKTNRRFIHPTANGTVRIEDISTTRYPDGVELSGKWDFKDVDDIGIEVLKESRFFKILLKNKKLEVVGEDYIKKYKHKIEYNSKLSPTERALNKILIKNDRPGTALDVATGGGHEEGDIAVRIDI